MKYFKILIVLSVSLLVISCNTVKKGFSNQKKNNSDEFLVEKKKPLTMPPDFDVLPEPKIKQRSIEEENSSIKSLLLKENSNNSNNEINNQGNKLEQSLLEKIQNN